jgi:VanZ family protein
LAGDATAPGRSPATRRGALWYWAPLAVWLGAIFFFSTDALSSAHTSRFVEPLIRRLLPGASEGAVYAIHVAVRKCGHLTEYALLALLAFRGARGGRPEGFRPGWAATAFAVAAVYALVDEYHQTFVSSRTGNLGDAAIDMTGAAAALLFLAWARSVRRSNSGAAPDV